MGLPGFCRDPQPINWKVEGVCVVCWVCVGVLGGGVCRCGCVEGSGVHTNLQSPKCQLTVVSLPHSFISKVLAMLLNQKPLVVSCVYTFEVWLLNLQL